MRDRVIDLLGEQKCALSAQEIEDALRSRGHPVARATVYRTLELLVAQGLAGQESAGWLGTSQESRDRRWDLAVTALLDGTITAYDDQTLDELWKINVGSGFNAPPMTFETGGKQYVAILTGISPITKSRHVLTPELREMRNQTMLFVFGL